MAEYTEKCAITQLHDTKEEKDNEFFKVALLSKLAVPSDFFKQKQQSLTKIAIENFYKNIYGTTRKQRCDYCGYNEGCTDCAMPEMQGLTEEECRFLEGRTENA